MRRPPTPEDKRWWFAISAVTRDTERRMVRKVCGLVRDAIDHERAWAACRADVARTVERFMRT